MNPSREGFDISRIISLGSFGEGTVGDDEVDCELGPGDFGELGLEELQPLQLIGLSEVGLEKIRGRCSGLMLMNPNCNGGGLLFSFCFRSFSFSFILNLLSFFRLPPTFRAGVITGL